MKWWKLVLFGIGACLFARTYLQSVDLKVARAQVKHAQQLATAALARSTRTHAFATAQAARADSAEQAAEAHATRAQVAERRLAQRNRAVLVAQAPDTCRPVIDALTGAHEDALVAAAEWRGAYAAEQVASASLRARGDSLASANTELAGVVRDLGDASKALLDATQPSFWKRLTPKVGVGATVGVQPFTQQPAVAVGLTLSWTL